jgi:hypothetical protein
MISRLRRFDTPLVFVYPHSPTVLTSLPCATSLQSFHCDTAAKSMNLTSDLPQTADNISKTTRNAHDDDIILESPSLAHSQTCPYHKDVLALKNPLSSVKDSKETPMERFLNTHPSKQSSIVALTNSRLNITKGCTCANGLNKKIETRF